MALTHETAIRNGLADYVVDAIDAGTTDSQGDLVIMTTGEGTEVATLNCSATAFGAATGGTATAAAISSDTSATGGTAATFKFQDRDNTRIFGGTVTAPAGGGDIELSSTSIGAGDTRFPGEQQ